MLNKDKFRDLIPSIDPQRFEDLYQALTILLPKYHIDTPRRLRYFIAQVYFETQGFTKFAETLYYTTPERLCQVWPSRFTMNRNSTKLYAPSYIRNSEALANVVYANRYGNGGPRTGDGYRYRGRGGLHLTFLSNYRKCSRDLYGDDRLVEKPELVSESMFYAMETALWFWRNNNLNTLADKDEFTLLTKRINGSASTAPQRIEVLRKTRILL